MKYLKSLGFYFCEFLGATVNLMCSFFSYYPCWDLGVRFYVFLEGQRVVVEQAARLEDRQEKEEKAASLQKQAKENG
jgi:hypothetical protein